MRALVIDDSRVMRTVLGRELVKLGYEVTEAADGQQAVEALESAAAEGALPDLCTIDWNMPVMDGLTFVQTVRQRPEWRNITLMMVTTEGEHGQLVRALAAGAHEYLIKPFPPESFIDKLALLGLAGSRVA
jgi:two-component system chemotaxis response regulator CheY